MKTKVFISDDNKTINGSIVGIKKIEKTTSGKILIFNDYNKAYHAAQVLINSGYETVRILEREWL